MLRIRGVIWLRAVVDKLAVKHHVETFEVEEALEGKPQVFFVEKGERRGEDVYMALGQTGAGRHLTVLFIHKLSRDALVLSARGMAPKERRRYGRKRE